MSMSQESVKEASESIQLARLHGKVSNSAEQVPISKGEPANDVETQNQGLQGLASPTLDVAVLQKWNSPRGNIARFGASFYSIFVFGLSDAAYGALLPSLEEYYGLSYTVVSLIFLCPFAGYTAAAFSNSWFHHKFGQRGICIVAPSCHVFAYIILSIHPPWPVFVLVTCFAGFGNGLVDAAWSSWAGHMVAGNILEGTLHAFYALGCTFSPLIVTSLITQRGLQWYYFYYVLTGLSVVALVAAATTFWDKTGKVYEQEHPREAGVSSTRMALRNKVTWLCCVFFLLYVGAEVVNGGWIVTFMLRVRHASPFVSGIVGTGFWAGMTIGRCFLGIVTHNLIEFTNQPHKTNWVRKLQLTERSILTVYLVCAIGMELLFWLVPSVLASAIAVGFLGLFLGPVFPSGVIIATKLLPGHLHIPSIGFATALGGCGGAVFPFITGAIAQAKGVQVLQPIVLAMLVVLLLVWLCFPRMEVRDQ